MITLLEKLGIRLLTHFLVMGIIRLFVLNGNYASFDFSVMAICLIYAFIITIFLECFDQWVIQYAHYYVYMMIGIMIIGGAIIYLGDSMFHCILFGYLIMILMKETWHLSTIQLALKKYQKEYKNK